MRYPLSHHSLHKYSWLYSRASRSLASRPLWSGYLVKANEGLVSSCCWAWCNYRWVCRPAGKWLNWSLLLPSQLSRSGFWQGSDESCFRNWKDQGIKRFFSVVSTTSKPFYEHFGLEVAKAQEVEIRRQILRNFVMKSTANWQFKSDAARLAFLHYGDFGVGVTFWSLGLCVFHTSIWPKHTMKLWDYL